VGLILVFIISVSTFATLQVSSDEPFYVGVTYCGASIAEAKQLIDTVKNFTNLFVLQSSALMTYRAISEIGDYAVAAGLKFIFYYGDSSGPATTAGELAKCAEERWNSSFLGVYYKDEPGGKWLEKKGIAIKNVYSEDRQTIGSIFRNSDGAISVPNFGNGTNTFTTFYPTGKITVSQTEYFQSTIGQYNSSVPKSDNQQAYITKEIEYQPNGTITCSITNTYGINAEAYGVTIEPFIYQPDGTVQDKDGKPVTDQGNISQFTLYQELWAQNPLSTSAKTADTFADAQKSVLDDVRNQSDTPIFTSDYALYWFDYQGTYDTVFAQFVGNESRARHIALCRGAAETLGKDWGVIVTWKYNQAPYLESGDELYSDLSIAYSSGAKYAVVFSYPNLTAYGTLAEEHFEALEKFWTALHSNPASLGSTPSKVAYVVPADYGFGFRSATDTIWGQFQADELSAKIYKDVVTLTNRYGASLNILYDGSETGARLGGYSEVYYYNQTIT
jgi:hypothetical protein